MSESPRRLGRGLATLLGGDQAPREPTGALRDVALDDLLINPDQPRSHLDPQALEELAQSIAQQGVLQPLLVRPTEPPGARFQIVAGERRWRAARMAGLSEVPCLIQPLTNQAASLAALVENLQRDNLDALDEAEGFRRVITAFGLSQDQLAHALGKSRSHVANTLRLLSLPPPVSEALRTRRISAGHARALLSHADPVVALAAVLERGLSVRATEELLTTPREQGAPRTAGSRTARPITPESADPDLRALEHDLSERLGLAVHIASRRGRGQVTIAFGNPEQLEGILALLAHDRTLA